MKKVQLAQDTDTKPDKSIQKGILTPEQIELVNIEVRKIGEPGHWVDYEEARKTFDLD